jgi:hypothetical protein
LCEKCCQLSLSGFADEAGGQKGKPTLKLGVKNALSSSRTLIESMDAEKSTFSAEETTFRAKILAFQRPINLLLGFGLFDWLSMARL